MHTHNHHDECPNRGERGMHGGFGRHGFKPPHGMGGMMGGPHGFGGPGSRMRRGDVRTAILRLLAEAPMHGYQMIQELATRSDGAWTPSPGSVYPVLQLLADEGLVTAEEAGGKRVFTLTETGTAEVAKTAEQPAPWEQAAQGDSAGGDYRTAAAKLMHAVFQIGKSGSKDQVAAAIDVLNDARKKLYAILAED